jgi:chemotaxis protein MotC
MMRDKRITFGLAAALLLAASARGQDAPDSFVLRVAKLQNVQAAIAQGDQAAYAAQPKVLREISDAIGAAKPEVWRNSRESRAAIIYVLSGGQPRILMRLIENGTLPQDDEKLMRGAIAYQLGHEAEARHLIGDVDPKTLGPALGGQLAFVQSILLTSTDQKKAIALLDLARLMMPGGLVEEAALRREAFLVADGAAPDPDKFMALAGQYLGRFPKSPYADNFLRAFTATLIRLHLTDDVANLPKIEAMTQTVERDPRRALFLMIARAALVGGKIAMADVAATKALTLAQADTPDEARGKFYQAAARSLSDQHEVAIAQLQAIDLKKLPKADEALLTAARTMARHVYEKTAVAPETPPPSPPNDSAAETIQLAEAALKKAQQMTDGSAP